MSKRDGGGKRRRSAYIALALVAITGVGLYIAPRVRRFLAVDACLDRGGAWNYQNDTCEEASTAPVIGDERR
jgi:hypothetical protein